MGSLSISECVALVRVAREASSAGRAPSIEACLARLLSHAEATGKVRVRPCGSLAACFSDRRQDLLWGRSGPRKLRHSVGHRTAGLCAALEIARPALQRPCFHSSFGCTPDCMPARVASLEFPGDICLLVQDIARLFRPSPARLRTILPDRQPASRSYAGASLVWFTRLCPRQPKAELVGQRRAKQLARSTGGQGHSGVVGPLVSSAFTDPNQSEHLWRKQR